MNEKHKIINAHANYQLSIDQLMKIAYHINNNMGSKFIMSFKFAQSSYKRMQTYQGVTRWCDYAKGCNMKEKK